MEYKSNKTFRESSVLTYGTKRQKKDTGREVLNELPGMEFYGGCDVLNEAFNITSNSADDNNKPMYSESYFEFHTNDPVDNESTTTQDKQCLPQNTSEDVSTSKDESSDESSDEGDDSDESEDEEDNNHTSAINHDNREPVTQEVKNDKVLCAETNYNEDCNTVSNTNELDIVTTTMILNQSNTNEGVCDKPLEFEALVSNVIQLHDSFNKPITLSMLPASLEGLVLGNSYNQPFVKGALPDSLKYLTLGDDFNQFIDVAILPPNLKKITFGSKFNQRLVKGMFPNSLEEIIFGREFDQSLVDCKDPNLLSKTNSGSFFKNLFALFGKKQVYDISSYSVLPPQLKILSFGYNFNQPILKDVLPKTLMELKVSTNYKHALDISISKSVV